MLVIAEMWIYPKTAARLIHLLANKRRLLHELRGNRIDKTNF